MPDRRNAIVIEALSWRGTRWGHHQRLKGGRADCAGNIAEVYERTGEIAHVDIPWYAQDIMHHRTEEVYYAQLRAQGFRALGNDLKWALPGNLAMFRWGRMNGAQGCVVVNWPWVVGAIYRRGVMLVDATEPPLRGRLSGFWTTIDGNL